MVLFFSSPQEDQECPDCHPLNRDEIEELLEMALTDQCPQTRARVQIRLTQGIFGMTCPRPGPDTHLADVSARVDRLYLELMRQERQLDQTLVDQLDELLNWI